MYIYETTAQERLIIGRALDDIFISLDRVHNLLAEVIETHFGDWEKSPIDAADAENIACKLEIIGDIIFDSVLGYSLTIGRGDFRGVAPYLEGAERAALAVNVEKQLASVFPGIESTERRKEIMTLPDEQALAVLEKEAARV